MSDEIATDADCTVEPWEGTREEWDAFVGADEDGTFCHLSGWRTIMEDVLGHRSRSLAARAREGRGDLVGVLPLVEVKSRLFGHYLVSMPFLNYGGPLGTPGVREALGRAAADLAADLGVDLMELRARRPVPGDLRTSRRKVTVLLDLPEDPDVLWTDFKSKVRSQVRRPRKEDMEGRVGADNLDAFYRVFARNMRDLGTPVLPRELFTRASEVFGDEIMFSAVYTDDGQPVAGGCGFVYGAEYEMTWASSLWEFNRQAPNMLLYWTCMEESIERGLKTFNFGRCTPDSGTHRFKLQWGGYDEPLPWAQWSSGGAEATPSPESGLYRIATELWSRLPLPLANRLGPFLSRRIP